MDRGLRRKGTVTFALALSPADHIQASYKGPLGKQYLDYIAAWPSGRAGARTGSLGKSVWRSSGTQVNSLKLTA